MIKTLHFKELLDGTASNIEDDLIISLIFGGVALADMSGNPLWAEAAGAYRLFNKLYKDFLEISTKTGLMISDELVQKIFSALGFKVCIGCSGDRRLFRSDSLDDVETAILYLEKKYRESKYFNMIMELSKGVDITHLSDNAGRIRRLIRDNGFHRSIIDSLSNCALEIDAVLLSRENTFLRASQLYFSEIGFV